MSNLIPYNNNFILLPFGLYNNSVLCYFNSLIQSLFSCTSLTEYLLYNEKNIKNNEFLNLYIKILKKYSSNNIPENNSLNGNLTTNENILLFNEFLLMLKNKNINFGYNQEDSGELLILLLDLIDDPKIYNLFYHTYRCNIYCKKCKYNKDIKNDISIQFEIDINMINNNYLKYQIDNNLHNLNKYIRNNYSDLLYLKCDKCELQDAIKINRLILVPTIIIINFNKYLQKEIINYPTELYFINKSENIKYNYKLVSSIHHDGSMNFGHYYSKSIRKQLTNNLIEFDIFKLNDNFYTKDTFQSNSNTYLLFYHYIDKTLINEYEN
jgi:ubiquitin C-terminal hydrolase